MYPSRVRRFTTQNFLGILLVVIVVGFLWSMYSDVSSGAAWRNCRSLHQEATCNHILGR